MGWKLARFEICGKEQIQPNEEKDICIELEEETRAAIHGVVTFPGGKPVCGAVVKLFLVDHDHDHDHNHNDRKFDKDCDKDCDKVCDLIPVTFAFTDKCGQFLFGVKSEKDYVIKVFFFRPEKVVPCGKKPDMDC